MSLPRNGLCRDTQDKNLPAPRGQPAALSNGGDSCPHRTGRGIGDNNKTHTHTKETTRLPQVARSWTQIHNLILQDPSDPAPREMGWGAGSQGAQGAEASSGSLVGAGTKAIVYGMSLMIDFAPWGHSEVPSLPPQPWAVPPPDVILLSLLLGGGRWGGDWVPVARQPSLSLVNNARGGPRKVRVWNWGPWYMWRRRALSRDLCNLPHPVSFTANILVCAVGKSRWAHMHPGANMNSRTRPGRP